jgi:hypothetical protein
MKSFAFLYLLAELGFLGYSLHLVAGDLLLNMAIHSREVEQSPVD